MDRVEIEKYRSEITDKIISLFLSKLGESKVDYALPIQLDPDVVDVQRVTDTFIGFGGVDDDEIELMHNLMVAPDDVGVKGVEHYPEAIKIYTQIAGKEIKHFYKKCYNIDK